MEHWYPTQTLLACSETQSAIARAGERFTLTRHPSILRSRLRTLQLEALGVIEGVAVLPDSLATRYGYEDDVVRLWPFTFARLTGHGPTLDKVPDPGGIAAWLKEAEIALPDLAGWHEAVVADWPDTQTVRLLLSADMAFEWQLRFADVSVAGIMLADLFAHDGAPFSFGGIAAIGFLNAGTRWKRLVQGALDEGSAAKEVCRLQWLKALRDGAEEVVVMEETIARWHERLTDSTSDRRRSSQLRELCELIAARPSTSVAQAAELLGLSRQSSARLIAEAEELSLIREMTHGKYQRRYCALI